MTERERVLFTMLHEVATVLILTSEGTMSQKAFEQWRETWINDFGRFMLQLVKEQEEKEKGEKGEKGDKV